MRQEELSGSFSCWMVIGHRSWFSGIVLPRSCLCWKSLGIEACFLKVYSSEIISFERVWAQEAVFCKSTPWIFYCENGFGYRGWFPNRVSFLLQFPRRTNYGKVFLYPKALRGTKNHGEQIKRKPSRAQMPRKWQKSTGNKSRESLPVPKCPERGKIPWGTNQKKSKLCPSAALRTKNQVG